VSHHPVQGQDSHGAHIAIIREGIRANKGQLDAGMHPAHEGLSAMPFYDDFDLSTVDVLLISQYVFARFDPHCQHREEGAGRITAVGRRAAESIMQSATCISV
jgi:hypothetical protein